MLVGKIRGRERIVLVCTVSERDRRLIMGAFRERGVCKWVQLERERKMC